jgi:hypothetical protein
MKTECIQFELELQGGKSRRIVIRNDGQIVSSDGGLVILSRIEQRRHWIKRLAECFQDKRDGDRITFEKETLLRQQIFGLAQGYEDLTDHEVWRTDPLLALACGLAPYQDHGAGKSTLSRFQLGQMEKPDRYKKIGLDPKKLERLLVEIFLESHQEEPDEIVLDFDSSDIPLYGEQEGRFFHGYYDEYCYLPLFCFCGQWPLLVQLRTADQDGASGTLEALKWIIPQIRERWESTRIIVRADSGFCRDDILSWIESQPGLFYVIGLARNSRLEGEIDAELTVIDALCRTSGKSQRIFKELMWRTLDSWSCERRVVAKAEALPGKLNPRFVVTNLPIKHWPAKELYENLYCARGDMENRIKEHQLQLFSTRTSCHEFRANQLRLWLSTFAYLYFVHLREFTWKGRDASRWEPATIRVRALKVAATVTVSTRRIVIQLPRSHPWWEWFKLAV